MHRSTLPAADETRIRRSKRTAPSDEENSTNESTQLTLTSASASALTQKLTKVTAASRRPALSDISNANAQSAAAATVADKLSQNRSKGRVDKPDGKRRRITKDSESVEESEGEGEFDEEFSLEILPPAAAAEPLIAAKPKEKTPAELIAEWETRDLASQSVENSSIVFAHLKSTESVSMPNPRYMDLVQGDLSFSMRAILVDWLVEVAEEYKLQPQSLFLAVSYTDRFLDKVPIDRSKLQLVGITSMLLAAKYWEIYPPSIEDFVYISDNTYRREDVVAMESAILSTLKFGLTVPTPWDFSKKFGKSMNCELKMEYFIEYLLELFLLESMSLSYKPSLIATAAVFLGHWNFNDSTSNWNSKLSLETGYSMDEIQQCVREMQNMLVKNYNSIVTVGNSVEGNTLKAVREKFSSDRFKGVAKLKPRAN